jgi:X-X-X-Leu-X-X-Gly heptad repeat protein
MEPLLARVTPLDASASSTCPLLSDCFVIFSSFCVLHAVPITRENRAKINYMTDMISMGLDRMSTDQREQFSAHLSDLDVVMNADDGSDGTNTLADGTNTLADGTDGLADDTTNSNSDPVSSDSLPVPTSVGAASSSSRPSSSRPTTTATATARQTCVYFP